MKKYTSLLEWQLVSLLSTEAPQELPHFNFGLNFDKKFDLKKHHHNISMMAEYILYHDGIVIKTYYDIDIMKSDMLEMVEYSLLREACSQNENQQSINDKISILKNASDGSFWSTTRDTYGYYYKTY